MSTIKEIALLVSRILFGVILIAHGWDKFQITGLEGVTGYFASSASRLPDSLQPWSVPLNSSAAS